MYEECNAVSIPKMDVFIGAVAHAVAAANSAAFRISWPMDSMEERCAMLILALQEAYGRPIE